MATIAVGTDASVGRRGPARIVVGWVLVLTLAGCGGNEWTYCEIGGLFPASVEFQVAEIKHEGDWFQFIDRGDGGVHFSAVLDGAEYSGTRSGEADEIRDDGFTYTGSLNRGGEVLDTTLDVTC